MNRQPTVRDILQKTEAYLREKNVDSPRLSAQLILSKGLGAGRMQLFLDLDRPLKPEELGALRPLVADPKYWDDNFGDTLVWMRPDGSNAITGFMTQLTLTGGFANKTLFEQAGVALPGDKATWDDWVNAAEQPSPTWARARAAWPSAWPPSSPTPGEWPWT